MTRKVSTAYALRSLMRHPRRSLLSALGIGVGCAMVLLASSWVRGATGMQERAVSESGAGHICVVPKGWTETREDKLRLPEWRSIVDAVQTMPGVDVISVRARTNGLLAFGNRSAGVQVTGVDPAAERQGNRIVYKSELRGRYLEPGDRGKAVIGGALARRLRVDVGDDLYATLAGRDDIQAMMLEVVGVLETGSREIDLALCHVNWSDVEAATGYPGVGQISVLFEEPGRIGHRRRNLEAMIGDRAEVITWVEVNPQLSANVRSDRAFTRGLLAIIMLIVVLGIASAQLAAVLERRREFAILKALGMKGRQVVGLLLTEAGVLAAAGGLLGLALGCPAAWWLSTSGVSLEGLMGDEVGFSNVLLEPVIYGDFGLWLVWQAAAISYTASLVATLYPAWMTTHVDPAQTLRTV